MQLPHDIHDITLDNQEYDKRKIKDVSNNSDQQKLHLITNQSNNASYKELARREGNKFHTNIHCMTIQIIKLWPTVREKNFIQLSTNPITIKF